jgi:hypothetical protein
MTALNRAAARTESRRAGRRVLARLSRTGRVLHAVVGRCGRHRQPGQRHLPVGMDFERELLLAKRALSRLGHASIQMTAGSLRPLFPRRDDGAESAAAEKTSRRP